MSLYSTVNLVSQYFLSIGVKGEFIESNLRIENFDSSIILNLPDVCVVKENRLNGSRGKQVHIHVTGDDMLIFYDETILAAATSSTEDEELEIRLIDSNIEHLEAINSARRDIMREPVFRETSLTTLIHSSTVKKISKRAKQAPQVQISKIRMDDENFINLRQNLFTGDRLIFLRYADNQDRYMVVGIPSTFDEGNIQRVTMEVSNEQNIEVGQAETQQLAGSRLRAVDIDNIATYEVSDEDDNDDTSDHMFDLSRGISIIRRRTERHSDIVRLFARSLMERQFSLYEGRIDCLGIREEVESPAIIAEIKTLNGTESDENSQVMKAFSQVFYYEQFHMGEFQNRSAQKVVVFESRISDAHIEFFERNEILVFWVENNTLTGTAYALEFLNSLSIIG